MSIFRKKKNLNKFKNYFKILIKLILKNPLTFYLHIFNFFRDYKNIKKDIINTNFDIYPTHPYLFDKNDKNLKLEYFHFQDLWAFKTLSKNSIVELVDIGSNLSFIAFASSVSKIKCIDIRPHKIILENVDFAIGDITNLPFENESINNISSLSVIEHIGLGRYGDEIDLFGMEKSAMEFNRVLKKNGNLIISFPFGKKNIIEFNAHRICNFEYINQLFKNYNIKNETFIFKSKYNSRDEFKQSGEPDCIACFHFVKK
tara:strand:+ start:6142 stop:6915 length:774 start_codon:yes stop_codon:yes gene_type:complete